MVIAGNDNNNDDFDDPDGRDNSHDNYRRFDFHQRFDEIILQDQSRSLQIYLNQPMALLP